MKRVWLTAFGFWIVASALACWFYPIMIFDACNRYAPMASALAVGDWAHGFHPRFGVLFQVVSGALAWGVSWLPDVQPAVVGLVPGEAGVQSASFLFLALAGAVMFAFAKRLTNSEKVAWWTMALVLLAPDFYRFALDGLREPTKCLAFALAGYGAISRRGWAFGLGLFVYVTSFAYGFAVSGVLMTGWVVCMVFLYRRRQMVFPELARQTLAVVVPYLLGVAAVSAMIFAYTGYFVPIAQLATILEMLNR